MTSSPRQAVVRLIADQGQELIDDRTRIRGFLKDLLVGRPREITALLAALEWGITTELRSDASPAQSTFRLDNLSQHLTHSSGLPVGTARWAVETWALALKASSAPAPDGELPEETVSNDLRVGTSRQATHRRLSDAIAVATAGATIVLEPGIYHESVLVGVELNLIGQNESEATLLEGSQGPTVIWEADSGSVRGIHVRTATKTFPALLINRGAPHIEACELSGPGAGIVVAGESQPTLATNVIRTEGTALEYLDDSGGSAVASTFLGQRNASCICRDQSHPHLEGIHLREGHGHGVVLSDDTSAHLAQTTISGMAGTGMWVQQRANPTCTATRIEQTTGDGTLITDKAGGHFIDHQVIKSDGTGVRVRDEAEPVFDQLSSSHNAKAGVWITDKAGGKWRQCTVEANAKSGMSIATRGTPHISKLASRENHDSGVHFYRASRGLLEHSLLEGNRSSGVAISDGADPLLTENTIRGNHGPGMQVYQQGRGEITGGVIEANEGSGLLIFADGEPRAQGVVIRANGGYGVQTDQTAAGEIGGCRLEGNTEGPWLVLRGAKLNRVGNQVTA